MATRALAGSTHLPALLDPDVAYNDIETVGVDALYRRFQGNASVNTVGPHVRAGLR